MQEKLSKAQLEKLGLEQKVRSPGLQALTGLSTWQAALGTAAATRYVHAEAHASQSVPGTCEVDAQHKLLMLCCVAVVLQLGEKESTESTLQKHQQQMREDLNKKLAECQEYRAMVHKLQAQMKEQEGK